VALYKKRYGVVVKFPFSNFCDRFSKLYNLKGRSQWVDFGVGANIVGRQNLGV